MKDDIKLPPLPKGDIGADTCPVMWVHTDQQIENYAREAIKADRQQSRGEPVSWTTHEIAIVVDPMYEGEGPSLAVWNGKNYQFSDGYCYERETDGSLDGYTAEWLTHHQLEQRLFAQQPAEPVRVPSDEDIERLASEHLNAHAQFVGAGEVH